MIVPQTRIQGLVLAMVSLLESLGVAYLPALAPPAVGYQQEQVAAPLPLAPVVIGAAVATAARLVIFAWVWSQT